MGRHPAPLLLGHQEKHVADAHEIGMEEGALGIGEPIVGRPPDIAEQLVINPLAEKR